MAFTTLFTNQMQAASYAQFRPRYPAALYQEIFEFMGLGSQQTGSLAVDVATGSGQALAGLTTRFAKVIGVDVSPQQLANAGGLADNVELRAGDAHELPLEDGSADLVTVAQAVHWFDRPRFYQEAARVLRPGGVLAVWCYDAGHVLPVGGSTDQVYQHVWNGVLGPYWAAPRLLVDNHYRDIEPLQPMFASTARRELHVQDEVTLQQLVGYVGSWSAYITYKAEHPDLPDPLTEFKQKLLHATSTDDEQAKVVMTRQITILLGKKEG